eukprot:COSAG02_NODE_236_length_27740_cov_49.156073_15_plen_205_part_00
MNTIQLYTSVVQYRVDYSNINTVRYCVVLPTCSLGALLSIIELLVETIHSNFVLMVPFGSRARGGNRRARRLTPASRWEDRERVLVRTEARGVRDSTRAPGAGAASGGAAARLSAAPGHARESRGTRGRAQRLHACACASAADRRAPSCTWACDVWAHCLYAWGCAALSVSRCARVLWMHIGRCSHPGPCVRIHRARYQFRYLR